jgi:acetyltransferase-like isoleucine patch superfamily enzyme
MRVAHWWRQFAARRRLLAQSGIDIAERTRIDFSSIRPALGSAITIGAGTIVEAALITETIEAKIQIGRDTFIGKSLLVSAESISVGDDVLISWGCNIVDHDSHSLQWQHRAEDVKNWFHGRKDWTHVPRAPIVLEDKVWVGFDSSILKGVRVGTGSVIAAGSVVTRDVPAWTLVGGVPARPLRELERQT